MNRLYSFHKSVEVSDKVLEKFGRDAKLVLLGLEAWKEGFHNKEYWKALINPEF